MEEIVYNSQSQKYCQVFGFNCRKGRKLERLMDGDRLLPGDFYYTENGPRETITPGEFIDGARITYFREVRG